MSRLAEADASDLLLAEFIHRSANDLAVACAEVYVATRLPTLVEVQERLDVAAARLRALASIQRLLQPPAEPSIDLGDRLCELCHYHSEARFAEQGAFVHLRTCDVLVDARRGWSLLMIVSELLTNAARHAFREPGGIVLVELARRADGLVCLVRDNGVGHRTDGRSRRAGTAIIDALARSADIALAAQPCTIGCSLELRVPCPEAARAADPFRDGNPPRLTPEPGVLR